MKPLLKWAGGKARIADKVALAFGTPCSGTYYEPFCGTGAVFLHRLSQGQIRGDAVLSDINSKLMETHKAIRDELDGVLEQLHSMPSADYRDHYYAIRDAFNEGVHAGVEHAARFIWLNRAGFNGLYRENRKGIFNVPVGRYSKLSFPTEERFRAVSEALQGTRLLAIGFDEILKMAKTGDQIYCDPPYVPLNATANFTAYSKVPFSFAHQTALATEAREAALKGAQVVISNHDLPLVRNSLYPESSGFLYANSTMVSRSISKKGSSRKPVLELMASIGPLLGDGEAA